MTKVSAKNSTFQGAENEPENEPENAPENEPKVNLKRALTIKKFQQKI